MIEFKNNEGKCSIKANGDLSELCADVTVLINEVYNGLEEKELKDLFKYAMTQAVNDGICFKTNEELKEIVKEKKEKIKRFLEKLQDLQDLLGNIQ